MARLTLFTTGNPKTEKGAEYGYATAILHLAPASLSGRNVCPSASQGCIASCLNTAGRGGLMDGMARLSHADVARGTVNTIQAARIRRTQWLFADRSGFLAAMVRDMERHAAWCKREGWIPAFRFNGTSDLDWQGMAGNAGLDLDSLVRRLGARAYDYTKVASRAKRESDAYSLTFSLSESNDSAASDWLANGGNVAVVFRVRPSIGGRDAAALPASAMIGGIVAPVVDGDKHDLRFLDARGSIIGLRAKGNAWRDASGFVREVA